MHRPQSEFKVSLGSFVKSCLKTNSKEKVSAVVAASVPSTYKILGSICSTTKKESVMNRTKQRIMKVRKVGESEIVHRQKVWSCWKMSDTIQTALGEISCSLTHGRWPWCVWLFMYVHEGLSVCEPLLLHFLYYCYFVLIFQTLFLATLIWELGNCSSTSAAKVTQVLVQGSPQIRSMLLITFFKAASC